MSTKAKAGVFNLGLDGCLRKPVAHQAHVLGTATLKQTLNLFQTVVKGDGNGMHQNALLKKKEKYPLTNRPQDL